MKPRPCDYYDFEHPMGNAFIIVSDHGCLNMTVRGSLRWMRYGDDDSQYTSREHLERDLRRGHNAHWVLV